MPTLTKNIRNNTVIYFARISKVREKFRGEENVTIETDKPKSDEIPNIMATFKN